MRMPFFKQHGFSKGLSLVALGAAGVATLALSSADGQPLVPTGPYVVFSYNDLGMHCTQEDFSEMCILPPYNTLRAQVIHRGVEPNIVNSGVTVKYSVPNHSRSVDKTNFWTYAPQLFGVNLAPDVGLTGHLLAGSMVPDVGGMWTVTGIPIMPTDDAGRLDPYPAALVTVTGSLGTASIRPVVPVSSEMSCSMCHGGTGTTVADAVLQAHDDIEGTNLVNSKPVLCASCHADPALGAPGQPGVSTLSHAMHGWHAQFVNQSGLDNVCYACHPGIRTDCQRDVHKAAGVDCIDCHGGMMDVANPARAPWTDEPRCTQCHNTPGFQYEQPGTLYRNSVGHSGVNCTSCHGSPHAIGPTITAIDNQQAITLQGHAGPINTCTVCHTQQPGDPFFHRVSED